MVLTRMPRIKAHATEVRVTFPTVNCKPPIPAIKIKDTTNNVSAAGDLTTDSNGDDHLFVLDVSGKDGSLFVWEY